MTAKRTTSIAAALAAASIAGLATAPGAGAAPEQLLVGFERGVSKERQGRVLSELGGRLSQRFSGVRSGRLVVVRPRSGVALDVLRKRLARSPEVAYAEPDFTLSASQTKTPNDPFYPFEWALVDGAGDHDIDAPEAWGSRTGCAKVAILDTGIDTDHPDLADNVYKSADKPSNGKDDDKNGYVDDSYGYNAIKGKGLVRTTTGTARTWPASWAPVRTTRRATAEPAGRPSCWPSSS
jgi:hypothetical protein